MPAYWVHYDAEGSLGPSRFVVFEVDASGERLLVSPPGGFSDGAEVAELLVARGAASDAAFHTVARAIREHLARVVIFGDE